MPTFRTAGPGLAAAIRSLLVMAVALLLVPLCALADMNGFKSMRWGSSLEDLQQTKKLVLTKEGGKSGATLYALENEELRFGKATLTGIHCSFAKGRLQGVILLFTGAKNFAAVKAEAVAKFGATTKFEQGGEEMYNWSGTITNSVLSYNKKSQSGFLFLKAKKMPPVVKAERKPPAKAPVTVAAGAEKTESTKSAPPVRSADPADMETALDRAEPLPPQPAAFSPEIQALIERDQALTHLCWETVGPAADRACEQMRENIERLKAMGLCIVPGMTGPTGTEVVWQRCGPAPQTTPVAAPVAPAPVASSPADPAASAHLNGTGSMPPLQGMVQIDEDKIRRCRLIGEFFAQAAQMRDGGVEPPVAEDELVWRVSSQTPEITIERIRETVELVYFDQEYNQARGEMLIQLVNDRCLSGHGPYLHPLP